MCVPLYSAFEIDSIFVPISPDIRGRYSITLHTQWLIHSSVDYTYWHKYIDFNLSPVLIANNIVNSVSNRMIIDNNRKSQLVSNETKQTLL